MSRLGRIKRFSKGLSSGFNNRIRQLQLRKPGARASPLGRVAQRVRGRFKRELAWRSLEADEQLTASRLSYASKPLAAIFSRSCFQLILGCFAVACLILLTEDYVILAQDCSVKRFVHYRWVAESRAQMLAFGIGCSGSGCGPSVVQVPRPQLPRTSIGRGVAVLSFDSPHPADLFFLVVPAGSAARLGRFVVEGSVDGRSWERLWPGPGPWGKGPDPGEGVEPAIGPNSVGDVGWFTAEDCRSVADLPVQCTIGSVIRKDLHLHWHHHLTSIKGIGSCLAVLLACLAGACGKPHLARPLLLTWALVYVVVSLALAAGRLGTRELAPEWAEAPGVMLATAGVFFCEARLFLFLFLGSSLSFALAAVSSLACDREELEARGLVCRGGAAWQVEAAMSLLLATTALSVRCLERQALRKRGPAPRFPPPRVHFLGAEGLLAKQELLAFGVVRSIFGADERDYRRAASRLLTRVMTERKTSTAKSGALMAFADGLMVKSMTAVEASTLLAILRSYLTHLEGDRGPTTMLPRFFGAYIHQGFLGKQTFLVIMSNVFAKVPPHILKTMERLDLKGSSDDRAQRHKGAELMEFDLLRADRKFAAADPLHGAEFLAQLQHDAVFLLAQHMPVGPCGVLDYESLPEAYRGTPGLMDYSLLVGVVPRGTPGGLSRLDVHDERTAMGAESGDCRSVQVQEATVLVGIIDILQFWTPTKRAARLLKKGLGKERDLDGGYHGEILDTVKPEPYCSRFLGFTREAFTPGSWLESLPRIYGGDWARVTALKVQQLPGAQRGEALRRQRAALEARAGR